ncbi:hypothetical protein AVEN_24678-1 [Araneus ventricosus]|uniref:Uncharacterized protein n=1 Tax=Araneus ventricosus TaxID=182803 RepID=A0A4Y2R647_ARAVE|nr:hypothetical protein AVEN_24678-1 [Araneus ventricosus]
MIPTGIADKYSTQMILIFPSAQRKLFYFSNLALLRVTRLHMSRSLHIDLRTDTDVYPRGSRRQWGLWEYLLGSASRIWRMHLQDGNSSGRRLREGKKIHIGRH